MSFEARVESDPNDPNSYFTPYDPYSVITRQAAVFLIDGVLEASHWTMEAGQHHADSGMSLSGDGESWEANETGTLPSTAFDLALLRLTFNDADLDVDSSGRFNQGDVAALGGLFATVDPNDPNYFPEPNSPHRFNFNGDGAIDANDQAVLQALVDIGVDSGYLGDRDGDGVIDCDDKFTYATYLGQGLGDVDYVIELDADLNGHITQEDLELAHREILPGDADGDWSIDFDDLLIVNGNFGAEVGDPGYSIRGDADKDGKLDFDDILIINGTFTNSCP